MKWIAGFLAISGLFGSIWASIHPYPTYDELPHPVTLKSSLGTRFKRETLGPLRIKVFYHSSVDKLRPKDRRIIKNVVSHEFSRQKSELRTTFLIGFLFLDKNQKPYKF